MKVIKSIFLAIVLVLINSTSGLAKETPSEPTAKGSTVNSVNSDPVNDGSPIDQDLVFLMIAGLGLGTLMIYRNKIKKASM